MRARQARGPCARAASGRSSAPAHEPHANDSSLVSSLLPLPRSPVACGGGNDNLPPPPPPPPPAPAIASAAPAAAAASAAPAARRAAGPAGARSRRGRRAPIPRRPLPTVKILAPTKDQVIPAATAGDFAGEARREELEDGDGRRARAPHPRRQALQADLRPEGAREALASCTGGDALAEGQHVLVAFPSRANHESVKTTGALAIIEFWVGKKGDKSAGPRPSRCSSTAVRRANTKATWPTTSSSTSSSRTTSWRAGKDHVHIAVTGPGIEGEKTADATQFGPPFYLDNLQDGSYTVKLDLLGADGKPCPARGTRRRAPSPSRTEPRDAPGRASSAGSPVSCARWTCSPPSSRRRPRSSSARRCSSPSRSCGGRADREYGVAALLVRWRRPCTRSGSLAVEALADRRAGGAARDRVGVARPPRGAAAGRPLRARLPRRRPVVARWLAPATGSSRSSRGSTSWLLHRGRPSRPRACGASLVGATGASRRTARARAARRTYVAVFCAATVVLVLVAHAYLVGQREALWPSSWARPCCWRRSSTTSASRAARSRPATSSTWASRPSSSGIATTPERPLRGSDAGARAAHRGASHAYPRAPPIATRICAPRRRSSSRRSSSRSSASSRRSSRTRCATRWPSSPTPSRGCASRPSRARTTTRCWRSSTRRRAA